MEEVEDEFPANRVEGLSNVEFENLKSAAAPNGRPESMCGDRMIRAGIRASQVSEVRRDRNCNGKLDDIRIVTTQTPHQIPSDPNRSR